MTSINSVADIENMVDEFRVSRSELVAASDDFSVKSRQSLYSMLGKAKEACDVLLNPENAEFVAKALAIRQLCVKRDPVNQYSPIIAMLFGSWDHNVPKVSFQGLQALTKFKPARSAEKYASVMAWFDLKGVTDDFIGALDGNEGKMDGAIKEVRARFNPKAKDNEQTVQERIDLLCSNMEFSTVTTEIEIPADAGDFVALWARNVNGKLEVGGYLPIKKETVHKAVQVKAKALEKELGPDARKSVESPIGEGSTELEVLISDDNLDGLNPEHSASVQEGVDVDA